MAGPNDEASAVFDMDSAVADIGADLGFGGSSDDDDDGDDLGGEADDAADDAPDGEDEGEVDGGESDESDPAAAEANAKTAAKPDEAAAPQQATNIVREPPKSWAKETHAHWATLKPEVQEYIHKRETQFLDGLEQYKGAAQYAKTIDSVIAPYRQVLASQKLQEPQAIASLMRAHVALTTGSPESRRAAFEQLAKNMGYSTENGAIQAPPPPTPTELELQRRLDALDSERAQQREAEQARLRAETDALVETFAADPAHTYFNEVAPDMRRFVADGMDLDAAYDAAVWSNPVTRAKQIAALETQWKAEYDKDAKTRIAAARRGTSSNVRAVESQRAPTEPKGKFLSTSAMQADLAAIKSRAQ